MKPIRTLILSGGGGRGAFHAGAYKYLLEQVKPGLDAEHQLPWTPDIVVGTSIGAVNGAAIAQGISAQELEQIWLSLREHDIQGIPPSMRGVAKSIANMIYKRLIGVKLPTVPAELSTSPTPAKYWPPLPLVPNWLADRIIGRWANLLDTGPLRRTLQARFHLDLNRIADSPTALMITATNVRTGERKIFSNKPITSRITGQIRRDVSVGIDLDRILASCSIPLVYPWTYDQETKAFYWDGAVVANTPLGAALDAARDQPVEIPMEVVVVLMTPWWVEGETPPERARQLPASFGEAITWALDWALLASFRERLDLINAYNRIAEQERLKAEAPGFRLTKVIIVAPKDFFPVERIIDYDVYSHELIMQGYEAAETAFKKQFAG